MTENMQVELFHICNPLEYPHMAQSAHQLQLVKCFLCGLVLMQENKKVLIQELSRLTYFCFLSKKKNTMFIWPCSDHVDYRKLNLFLDTCILCFSANDFFFHALVNAISGCLTNCQAIVLLTVTSLIFVTLITVPTTKAESQTRFAVCMKDKSI